jgi:formylglycine-generating enzyme required for sulfatase activity
VNADGYDDVIIGADEYDAGQADEGAAFVFLGGAAGMPDGTPATAAARLESDAPGGRLGSSVSGAGDVDKDGYDDVIVGGELTGAALVFHGGASGVPSGSPATADTVLDLVGNSVRVSGAGDVDGDGYDDVVVGSPFYAAGQSLEGAAFVFHGSAVGIPDADPSTAHAMIQSDQASAFLGTSVSGAGDVDGDGYDEIVVGSNGFDPAGAAFLFLGSSTGIVTDGTPLDAVAVLVPPVGGSSMGDSVSGDFDSNGDGYADSIVGDRQWGAGNEGAAFVYHGSSPAASATAVAPVSVLTTSEWTGTPAPAARKGNLINGSGLSGIGPVRMQTHSNAGGTFWHAGQGDGGLGGPVGAPPAVDTQAAVFDLGGWMDLEGTFIWNHNQYSWFARGVKELEILVTGETDPLTATFVSVGVFELASGDGLSPEPAQFRAFTAEHVRLVRFEFHSTHSGAANEWVGLSEVRFAAAPVAMRWAEIGDPGNACDTQADGCFGAVAEAFRMSQFEVTNAQYAQFLNAVAATDTNALYHVNMGTSAGVTNTTWVGGITRTGSAGSYTYAPIPGKEDWPVNYVSFWDAARFANWLHNGQPTGAQDDTTTEDGAYALTPAAIAAGTVTRNPGALAFVPSEDEWFKAAYYDPATSAYFAYPAGADPQTACTAPGVTANAANCFSAAGGVLTSVGSYPGSPSPNGTYDQGGSIEEWNEATQDGFGYVQRGGQFESSPVILAASWRWLRSPTLEFNNTGFRVASPIPVPEPGLVLGLGTGIACLSLLARRRRICAGVG